MPAANLIRQWNENIVTDPRWAALPVEQKAGRRKAFFRLLEADKEYQQLARSDSKKAARFKTGFLNKDFTPLTAKDIRAAEKERQEAEQARLTRQRGRLGGLGFTPAGPPPGLGFGPRPVVDVAQTVGRQVVGALDVPLVAANALITQRPKEAVETIGAHIKALSLEEQDAIINDLLGTTEAGVGRQLWERITKDPLILPGVVTGGAKLTTATGRMLLRKIAKRAAKELPVEDVPQVAKAVVPTEAPAKVPPVDDEALLDMLRQKTAGEPKAVRRAMVGLKPRPVFEEKAAMVGIRKEKIVPHGTIKAPAPIAKSVKELPYVPLEELPEGVSRGPMGEIVKQSGEVEAAIKAGRIPEANVPGKAANVWRKLKEARAEAFVEEPLLRKFPKAYATIKEFSLQRMLLPDKVSDVMEGTKTGFFGQLKNMDEVNQVGDYVILKDFQETARQGLRLPNDINPSEVAASLAKQRAIVEKSPRLKAAADQMEARLRDVGERLVDEGLLEPERMRDWYYPHAVLPYLEDGWRAMGGRKFQKPFFGPAFQRKGSPYLIRTDHIENLRKYLTSAEHVILKSRAIREVMESSGVPFESLGLTKNQFEALGVNMPFEVGGKRYMKYKFGYPFDEEGNAILGALDNILQEAGEKPVFIPRGLHKSSGVILPEELGQRLLSFSEPGAAKALRILNEFTRFWKIGTLMMSHIVLPTFNYLGNVIGAPFFMQAKNIPKYFTTDMAKGMWTAAKGQFMEADEITGVGKSLYAIAERQGLEKAGLYGEVTPFRAPRPSGLKALKRDLRLRWKTMTPLEKGYTALGRLPFAAWADAMQFGEMTPRIAMISRIMDELASGTSLKKVAQEVKLRGEWKTFEGAAGEITRAKMVDITSLTKTERQYFSGFLFPFYGFFSKNLGRFLRRAWWARKHPVEGAAGAISALGLSYFLTHMWNNSGENEEIEKNMPDYRRAIPHVITPFEDEKGDPYVFFFTQDVTQAALEMLGIEKAPHRLADVMKGRVKLRDAFREQAYDTPRDILHFWVNFSNPLLKPGVELVQNKKLFSGGHIVPPEIPEKSTEATRRQLWHLGESILRPLREARLMEEEIKDHRRGAFAYLSRGFLKTVDPVSDKVFAAKRDISKLVDGALLQTIQSVQDTTRWAEAGPRERDRMLRVALRIINKKLRRHIPTDMIPTYTEMMEREIGRLRAVEEPPALPFAQPLTTP